MNSVKYLQGVSPKKQDKSEAPRYFSKVLCDNPVRTNAITIKHAVILQM